MGGVGEGGIPRGVKQGVIQTSKSGRVPAVSPGEGAVEEWELEESEGVNHGVEGGGEGAVEIGVVLLPRGADEVEVPDDKPRPANLGEQDFHLVHQLLG